MTPLECAAIEAIVPPVIAIIPDIIIFFVLLDIDSIQFFELDGPGGPNVKCPSVK